MLEIILFIIIIILFVTLVFQASIIRDLKEENKAIGETLDNEIKDYDDLQAENLHLYQQLKEYQEEVEKKAAKKSTAKKSTAKKETTTKKEVTTTKKTTKK